jgi:hypothetical protein
MDLNNLNNLNFSMPSEGDISDAHRAAILDATGFDMSIFQEILELQNTLNERVNIDWKTANQDWDFAILLESNELLDSFDWKWWRAGITDWANIEIEMIDLFHFLIAKSIEKNQTTMFASFIIAVEAENKNKEAPAKDKDLEEKIKKIFTGKFIPNLSTGNLVGNLMAWLEVWYLIGKDINDIFLSYKMKYALNMFRQDNGYSTGEYMKIWNGVEDNVVAQRLIKNIPNDKQFIETLQIGLKKEYSELVKPKDKNLEDFIKNDPKWSQFITLVPEDSKKVMINLAEDFQKYLEK